MSKHLYTRHMEERSDTYQFPPEKSLQKNFLAPQSQFSRNKLLVNLKKHQNRSVFHPDCDFYPTRNPRPMKRTKSLQILNTTNPSLQSKEPADTKHTPSYGHSPKTLHSQSRR